MSKWKPIRLGLGILGLSLLLLLVYNISSSTPHSWISTTGNNGESISDRMTKTSSPDQRPLNIRELKQNFNFTADVAIVCVISVWPVWENALENYKDRAPLFSSLLPTFCKTSSVGFDYHFYFATSVSFHKREDSHHKFSDIFQSVLHNKTECINRNIKVFVHFTKFTDSPISDELTLAHDVAMRAAYLDHRAFYFRVYDDTEFVDERWTETFIETLGNMNPPFVGVTGPDRIGENTSILTHDFTHRTHQDIFGLHYSYYFFNRSANNWITKIYEPNRSIKVWNKRVKHTTQMTKGYSGTQELNSALSSEIKQCASIISQWVRVAREQTIKTQNVPTVPDPRYAVSMSLYGNRSKYTYGAIHNAVLVRHNFPGWTLRIYTEKVTNDTSGKYPAVPPKVIAKLKLQGAHIVELERSIVEKISPMMWRFLPADDLSLEAFISRDSDSRLTERDAVHVRDWLNNSHSTALHCIRDHPYHSVHVLNGGLWGARPKLLQKLLKGKTVKDLMQSRLFSSRYMQDMVFLQRVLWPFVRQSAYCHDAFACYDKRYAAHSHPFLLPRPENFEHIGQVFDGWGVARQEDIKAMKSFIRVYGKTKFSQCTRSP